MVMIDEMVIDVIMMDGDGDVYEDRGMMVICVLVMDVLVINMMMVNVYNKIKT